MVAARGLTLLLLLGLAAGCGLKKTVTVTQTQTQTVTTTAAATTTSSAAACAAGDLTAVFKTVPGSAGAGQISYDLDVTNTSQSACWVSGLPTMQLLDANGNNLPTQESAAHPGINAAKIILEPGDSATAQARFSPDVNGVGDSQTGACQPKAATVRAVIGSGTLDAPVQPPTSVCEQGSLHVDVFSASS